MKAPALACLLAAVATAPASADAPDNEAAARAAVMAFADALKTELVSAMQSGGPLNAIEVCNTRAPEIARQASLDNGMNLSRVSLRNRNPHNAPNDWQTAVLQDFQQRKQAGEAIDRLSWSTTAETGEGREFRFMKAIPTAPVCLACHGETLEPAVAEKIAELYPADKATGFKPGDLRGAFVVTRQLP
ncbi:MAG: DUF3365 domain-containing protein [Lysobacterales bacterium]|jgi:hypothetical protein